MSIFILAFHMKYSDLKLKEGKIMNDSGNGFQFKKLTPIKNSDLKIYEDALNFVFCNDDLKNVAISGPYSAGKSSLIESYKYKYHSNSYLHISLAHFDSPEKNNNTSKDYNEAFLEGKILNQLIHQIDPDKIPKTNFKVKQKVSLRETIKSTVFFTFFIILITYIFFFTKWSNYVSSLTMEWLKNILMWSTFSEMLLISSVLCTVMFGVSIHSIIRSQKNKNIFKRLKLQGNEIEIFQETEDSYFDKYLNEVLYLFENSDADVIVFEDIDRYNGNQIFEKLREINTLINNKKNKERKTPIRFFYLLRDDIFVSKDRTKFFDFIIPVVPVIDGSNSYDQFIEHFKHGGILELLDEDFLQGLSLYIDDMRILKNIYNEFIIYKKRVQSIELNNNKLLAIIAYKNIFPKDFSDLQLGKGYVHTLFKNKLQFIKKELKDIDIQINEIEHRIKLTNDEMLESIYELDAIYLLANYKITNVGGHNVSVYKTRVDLVKAMRENPNIQVYEHGNRQHNIQPDIELLLQKPEYIKRKEAIERKNDKEIEDLKNEIHFLIKHKSIIQNGRLNMIITKENIDNIFNVTHINEIGVENNLEEIKVSPYFPLIKFLIRNGHIDETYSDYMTYFYENSLSRIDKNFLLSITDQIPKDYSYSLKNPSLVLSRLRLVDFDNEEILNFDLLTYLLKTNSEMFLFSFVDQLVITKNYKFIWQFLNTKRETRLFVKTINNKWPNFIKSILTESNFSHFQKKLYATYTLYYSPTDDILELNKNNCLSKFISKSPDFLDIKTPNIEKLIDSFSIIDVKFEWIDFDVSNKELFDAVYKNNFYQLNYEFISLILEKVYGFPENSNFNNNNYTMINSRQNEPLVQNVNENIKEYFDVILEHCKETIKDEETEVLSLLNNTKIDKDKRKKYIGFLQTVLENIIKIEDKELWSFLLHKRMVSYSKNNILNYFFYSENGLDSYLIEFINSSNLLLDFSFKSIDNQYKEDSGSNFFNAIVNCNELSNERYESFLKALNRIYKSFTNTNITKEKVLILIKLNIIPMTDSELIFMREYYSEVMMPYIKQNIDKYINLINQDNFVLDEMLKILHENVHEKNKIKLLDFTNDTISLRQKEYSNLVKFHILSYNFDEDDLEFLLSCYSNESIDIKKAIKSISIEYIEKIIDEKYSTTYDLVSEILTSNLLNLEVKKEFFTISLPHLNEIQAMEALSILGMTDFVSLFYRKRPKIKNNEVNKNILAIFKQKNWITKFYIDKGETEFFRANGRSMLE